MQQKLLLVMFFVIFLPSCASFVKGSTESVTVASNPSNANVKVDGMTRGKTPLNVELQRKRDHLVTVEKEGYETVSVPIFKSIGGAVWGNILYGGFIGWGVDASTGAQYNLSPTNISVSLVAKSGSSGNQNASLEPSSFVNRLNELDDMMEQGRLSEEEYANMRAALFQEFYPELGPETPIR